MNSDDHAHADTGPVVRCTVKVLQAHDATHDLVAAQQLDALAALVRVVSTPNQRYTG